MQGRLYPVDDEWCEWRQQPPLPGVVMVRIAKGPDGRLVLAGLRIDGEPTADLLRSIPVGRIEAVANAQLAIVDDAIAVTATPGPRDGAAPHPPRLLDAGWETTDPDGATPRPAAGGRRRTARIRHDGQAGRSHAEGLPGQGGRGRGDGFYREVAGAYRSLAQSSARPAAELAEANGVPVTTAHRWVKEARRRGFLPPGRPGKTG